MFSLSRVISVMVKESRNYENFVSKDPLKLGFCSEKDLLRIAKKHKEEGQKSNDIIEEIPKNEKDDENNNELEKT